MSNSFAIQDSRSGLFWTGRGGCNGWGPVTKARTYTTDTAAQSVISNKSSWVTKRFVSSQWVDTLPTIIPITVTVS
jgi:hypothetical protein